MAQIAQFGNMMEKLGAIENKEVQKYTCVFSDSHHKHGAKKQILKAKRLATNKRKERRKVRRQKNYHNRGEQKNTLKKLSNKELTNDQINWASIKSGTWNIPENSGTSRNIPEHPGT